MCGHFGYATLNPSVNTKKKFDTFTQGLFVDTLRGFDSTGVAAVFHNSKKYPKPQILKRAIPAPDFITSRAYGKLDRKASDFAAVIGHNRAATVGKIIDEASHPYQHDHITLAHNGTLEFDTGLDGSFETDSEEIAYTMATTNEKETLERIKGAYALVWHNAENNTINFARNKDRTFAFAIAKDGKSLFWASESSMLHWILQRNSIDYDTIWNIKPGNWFSFSLDANTFAKDDSGVTTFVPFVKTTTHYGNGGTQYSQSAEERLAKFKLKKDSWVAMRVRPTDIVQQSGSKNYKIMCDSLVTHRFWDGGRFTDVNVRAAMYAVTQQEAEAIKDVMYRDSKEGESVVVYANPNTVYPMNQTAAHSHMGKNYEMIMDASSHWVLDTYKACLQVGVDAVMCGADEKKPNGGALVAVN